MNFRALIHWFTGHKHIPPFGNPVPGNGKEQWICNCRDSMEYQWGGFAKAEGRE